MEKLDKQGRPVVVKIGAFDFDIVWREKAWFLQEGLLGKIDFDMQAIDIANFLSPTKTAAILLHEITHGLLFSFDSTKKEFAHEQIAQIIENGLVALWRDNPKTFAWWSAAINAK